MCSSFFYMPSMENYQGDLADIVRAGGRATASQSLPDNPITATSWQLPPSDPISFPEIISDIDYFGDPFLSMRDPLLHELGGIASTNSSSFFTAASGANSSSSASGVIHEEMNGGYFGQTKTLFEEDQMKSNTDITTNPLSSRRPNCNIFSRMLQISPNSIANKLPLSPRDSPVNLAATSPREILNASSSSSSLVSGDMINANTSNSGVQQILSPRNPAIKRRKSQAKKVVCIPAPAPANSRPSGEVVPSDLWAWRKYGQKPIKGSPYPRGYYRCSSSKGCSARKQVERSRTDPNMLVITYTSEHNHPWPTQRNALAGSTRSQTSKNNSSKNSLSSQNPLDQPVNNLKEEPKEMSQSDDIFTSNAASVKEEMGGGIEKELEMDDSEFNDEFNSSQIYKPTMPHVQGSNQSSEDFFAELGEIEADSIELLLNPGGFTGSEGERQSKQALDPFSFLDWPSGSNINTTPSGDGGDEAKRSL